MKIWIKNTGNDAFLKGCLWKIKQDLLNYSSIHYDLIKTLFSLLNIQIIFSSFSSKEMFSINLMILFHHNYKVFLLFFFKLKDHDISSKNNWYRKINKFQHPGIFVILKKNTHSQKAGNCLSDETKNWEVYFKNSRKKILKSIDIQNMTISIV